MSTDYFEKQIKTPLYLCWVNMRQRCSNPKRPDWPNYGGRGISVCREWKGGFLPFKSWALENGYKQGLTLDRKNNNGDYTPENCRWATRKVQNNNRRYNLNLTIDGETKNLKAWVEDPRCSSPYVTVHTRILRGWLAKDAVFTPGRKLSKA